MNKSVAQRFSISLPYQHVQWKESHALIVQHASGKRYYGWATDSRKAVELTKRSISRHGEVAWAATFPPGVTDTAIHEQKDWDTLDPSTHATSFVVLAKST